MNISGSEWTLETFLTHVSWIKSIDCFFIADGWVYVIFLLKSLR